MSRSGTSWATLLVALVGLSATGCFHPREYVRNCFKVGPEYCRPAAPLEQHWIDAADRRVRDDRNVPCYWWAVFNDPVLNGLVADAYSQNLSLRQAGCRVLQARDQLGITTGNLFPQSQDAFGSYRRQAANDDFFNQWNYGVSLSWELDFWGRFRRAVRSADAQLEASVAGYDDVLVTLLGDIATNYVIVRTDQERIRLLQQNIAIQQAILDVGEERLRIGRLTSVDVEQLRSNLLQNQAQVEQLQIDVRQACNRLCVLLGVPPFDLERRMPPGAIPVAPPEVAVGMPAQLLSRRPDIRRAERLVAAQAEQIGIAVAALYPAISINGTLGYQAREFSDLFSSHALSANVGPSFQWNILNYGRLVNNIRLQDDRLEELIAAYQNSVLSASGEVEDGLVAFLRAQRRARLLNESANAATKAVMVIREQLAVGKIDFNQYAVIQQSLIQQQDLWAQARGQIAFGLITVYRALGGGWELRTSPPRMVPVAMPAPPGDTPPAPGAPAPEPLPMPPPPQDPAEPRTL